MTRISTDHTHNAITLDDLAEEHSVIGGLGSAVSEFLSEVYPTKVKKLGIYDKFGQSGKATELLEKYELTAAKLVAMVKENM